MGCQAEERSTENQWSHSFSTQPFGPGVTALESNGNQNKRDRWRDTGGEGRVEIRETRQEDRLTQRARLLFMDSSFIYTQENTGHQQKATKNSKYDKYNQLLHKLLLLLFY